MVTVLNTPASEAFEPGILGVHGCGNVDDGQKDYPSREVTTER